MTAPALRLWPGLSEAVIASWGGIVAPWLLPQPPASFFVVEATITSVSDNSPGAGGIAYHLHSRSLVFHPAKRVVGGDSVNPW